MVLTSQSYRDLGGWKLQYLQSFQANRGASNRLVLVDACANEPAAANASLSYVLAARSMPKFQQFKLSVTHERFK